ncbi:MULTISPECIES: MarR family winged helix-turn-helix transcriptional regulator [unclassified Fusibacter]|uniref:MarR family winged helix-turn-helix transcriptional regulator n=1 Tax=unclassified Fusibacter TaxID=2624464 RepID=UPI001010D59B|nr:MULTISPECIES: MarR family transcriptional regulator [unclassified Fusibacter]MCK8060368.1 MarR family transcriptional regulator [Fusibacter sp. A2]NPE20343.1 MarR family transcriptional regulator [Fusibacter sp. A1]RXV63549.1 MarR family transcriptional regulator [Fusibacter sp. A1]
MKSNDELIRGISNLSKLKGRCYTKMLEDLKLSEMSLKQINYLKVFHEHQAITTSQLAEMLNLSKPTVTEMVKKFIKNDYVVKQSCPEDGRVFYLKLTEKGKHLATLDELTAKYLASTIESRLSEEDLEVLISVLKKLA